MIYSSFYPVGSFGTFLMLKAYMSVRATVVSIHYLPKEDKIKIKHYNKWNLQVTESIYERH